MKNVVYVALGSNIGDRYTYLSQAIELLNKNPHIRVEDISSVYETDPVGYTDQNRFLNLVIKISTNLLPQELLVVTQKVEVGLGRKREIRWGPRTVDLDILLYNQENIESENLIVPHPRMFERAFVIVPLLEINQDIKQNISRSQVDEMKRREGVTVWKQKNGEGAFVLFGS
ncbi:MULTISPECIES: 2-amino-4-hydroxy-6-hydroxymethyldihydropteridine diphosphokinase [Bacillus cereus group]|jgi:2-amino-4-hydroxy-6-hydroxymethyldihydropteridine diphosphokinase|uniref:2-amino-4-hydroxy-6-hydroxymethyldihydropteridine diphosphokinase n=1 Tax=Bacillus cereus TaxID=1396 RepID=A0AA44Q809_BACCE|nr:MULTISPECIES: 2-amino-4-hydroxy-6-hydroxymethyldihydropteridine diphosphokinase [Bacillus cereus group]PFA16824.1 2-amino-4-hydroxy-6-hydroxymethyldihydropteridine diphosphokinase [Bacillus cereus]PFN05582.1 2-amino-4-hydroxy-6-hydroxymethyldihydropteridine diphosphokinase [Bacillus cereus]PFO83794.1 2-amino-4-hydroxy-6-hydroxymethyldihydropteridine diphosphokinase [Bacillus cereus]PFR98598.1 2-amino-4-hydroxy-6-hydroxymethyldihydropteridine diphosphokinase [Bacillus cereus]PGZ14460.1 2-ami